MRVKTFNNGPDQKNSSGLWLKSSGYSIGDTFFQTRTRAYNVWMSIENRGRFTENKFKDFQDFADWCQGKQGYLMVDSSGKFWSIDKDLKNPGNRVYSRETCIFVPSVVNSLMNHHSSVGCELPIGVHACPEGRKVGMYIASCREYPSRRKVGRRFNDAESAHRWWQEFKTLQIKKCLEEDWITEDIHSVLSDRIVTLETDLHKSVETKKWMWTNK